MLKDDDGKERKRRHDLRERAKKAMADITTILETLQKTAGHPERDFAKIFQDEAFYFRMVRVCHSAYEKSYKSNMKLFSPENLRAIQYECWAAGLFPSAKQLSDRHFRSRILEELAAKEVEPGFSHLQRFRNFVLNQKRGLGTGF
jgi:hypothetical protein